MYVKADELRKRAVADMENMRRRAEKQVADAHKFALSGFVPALANVRDNLQKALATGETTNADSAKTLREGIELTFRNLESTMERFHIVPINPDVGAQFDPNLHNAIAHSPPTPAAAPNTVAQVVQVGYMLNGRVIRAADVLVAAAASANPTGDSA